MKKAVFIFISVLLLLLTQAPFGYFQYKDPLITNSKQEITATPTAVPAASSPPEMAVSSPPLPAPPPPEKGLDLPVIISGVVVLLGLLFLFFILKGKSKIAAVETRPDAQTTRKEAPIHEARLIDPQKVFFEKPLELNKRSMTIGRDTNNDIVINQDTVSRLHATIDYRDGYFIIEDQRSSNGTSLNDRPLEPNKAIRLKSRDRIKFDIYEFTFIIPGQAPAGKTVLAKSEVDLSASGSVLRTSKPMEELIRPTWEDQTPDLKPQSPSTPAAEVRGAEPIQSMTKNGVKAILKQRNCPNHPSRQAIWLCTQCKQAYCEQCIIRSPGDKHNFCKDCSYHLRTKGHSSEGIFYKVHFSLFSPRSVTLGSHFEIEVYAHLEKQRNEVLERAQKAFQNDGIKVKTKGPVLISRGTYLNVILKIDEMELVAGDRTILWCNEIGNANYVFHVPKETSLGPKLGKASISIRGICIAKINFTITVGEHHCKEGVLTSGRHFKKAFASYAHQDYENVLGRIQGIQKILPDLEIFLDVLSLRSGQKWEEELYRVIPSNDIFYLFWSINAMKSHWVEKEWRCALNTKGIDFIDPIPLVSPNLAPPPSELAEKHFNDWVISFMNQQNQNP